METVGMRPVLVHGGGAAISRAMADAGLEPRFVHGRRYTDDATLDDRRDACWPAKSTKHSCGASKNWAASAEPLNFRTTNVLFGERMELPTAPTASRSTWATSARSRGSIAATIEHLCYAGIVPIIPSMCITDDGEEAQRQRRHGRHGRGPGPAGRETGLPQRRQWRAPRQDDPNSLINSLTAEQARELIASGAIESGMIPKVEGCLETLERGVRKIHIIDGRQRHSLLLEVYTSKGVGTEIVDLGDDGKRT